MAQAQRAILFGDSIRAGYQPAVESALNGAFEVFAPAVNSPSSRTTLAEVDQSILAAIDDAPAGVVLHMNCGLHDLKYTDAKNNPQDEPNVPLTEFEANVDQLIDRILQQGALPAERLVWALTTPVIDDWHNTYKPFRRYEADVRRYNDAATRACRKHGVRLNDLHAFVMSHGPDTLLTEDGVHYTDAGKARLGKQVAKAIRDAAAS